MGFSLQICVGFGTPSQGNDLTVIAGFVQLRMYFFSFYKLFPNCGEPDCEPYKSDFFFCTPAIEILAVTKSL